MKKELDFNIPYDIDGLVSSAKKDLGKHILKLCLCVLLLACSILIIILWGRSFLAFASALITACVTLSLCGRLLKQLKLSDYSNAFGEISEVHKDVRTVDTKAVGSVGLGVRKYDSYKRDKISIAVSIEDKEGVRVYSFDDVNEEQAEYYEKRGRVIHIKGTRFPVRLELDGKWLCPVCGKFNPEGEKACDGCNKKILK